MVKNGTFGFTGNCLASRVLPVPAIPPSAHRAESLPPSFGIYLDHAGIQPFPRPSSLASSTPGHIGKCHLDLILAEHTRLALTKGHGASTSTTSLHLAHEKDPQPNEDEQREPVDQYLHQNGGFLWWRGQDLDIVLEQITHQTVIAGAVGGKCSAEVSDPSISRPLIVTVCTDPELT